MKNILILKLTVNFNGGSFMLRIIMSGCNGRMGRVITQLVKERSDCEIVAGISIKDLGIFDYPVFDSPEKINVNADVVIDFSNPDLLEPLLKYCLEKKCPLILCTTGFSDLDVQRIKEAANSIPVFFSGNMSIGINMLIELSKLATKVLGDDFDIEIIDTHHNQKLDAPSGTALMIADAISAAGSEEYQYIYDRHSFRGKRRKNEIGIHSIRAGAIVGEHEVIFAGQDEVLKISHIAQSKEIFAVGAINAARFIIDKKPGLYNMGDIIKE